MAYTGFTDFSPAFVDTFNQGWFILSKEKSKLWNVVTDKVVQNSATDYYKRMGHGDLGAIGAKGSETSFSSVDIDQRAVTLAHYGRADLLSYEEIIKMGGENPAGQLVQRHAEAVARKRDEIVIGAFLNDASVKGSTAVALPSGQTVAADYGSAGTNTGLTLGKIRRAKVILDTNGVDENNRVAIVSSEDMDALLANAEVTSQEYNAVRALIDGTIEGYKYMGFTWIVSNRLPVASGVRSTIFAHAGAVKIGYNDMPSTTIDRLPTHNNNFAIQTQTFLGGVRMEEESVVKVLTKDL